jgi:TRAP-type C4-dicarboxylate transport system permease large subunit
MILPSKMGGYKTMAVVMGASLKGLGAAGIDQDEELERDQMIFKKAKDGLFTRLSPQHKIPMVIFKDFNELMQILTAMFLYWNCPKGRIDLPSHVLLATIVVVAAFACGMVFFRRAPLGLILIASSTLAAAAPGFGLPLRHVVEGMFTHLNIILICATGVVFLKSLEASGAAAAMTRSLVLGLYRVPALMLTVIMPFLLIPRALTGVAVNSVLSVGVLVAPIMLGIGIPPVATSVVIGMGAILSMLVPPTNLFAMSIAAGVNAPFEGFTVPTLILSVLLAVITGPVVGLPHVKKVSLDQLMAVLPDDRGTGRSVRAWLPLLAVVGIMAAIRAFPKAIPDIGTPFVFAIGTGVAVLTGKRFNLADTARKALSCPMLGVLELLVGVGTFVQITALTGIRGLLVVGSLSLPKLLAYLAAAVSLILSGGVLSPFGAASVFGVPFALFFLDRNQIIGITGLALLCALSQFTLPTAIAGRFAAEVAGVEAYGRVWRASLIPTAAIAVVALAVIAWADKSARILL